MDYHYDYNMNFANLDINNIGKQNNLLGSNNYNSSNINVSTSLNSNPNLSTNFTVTNSTSLNKDFFRDEHYIKNTNSIPFNSNRGNIEIFIIFIK
jgi:hypothetical protein